MIIELR